MANVRNSRSHKTAFRLGCESLERRDLLAVTPIITEFMAVNDSTLTDENNAYSDWIEIHNPTASNVSLSGWHLTDDSGDLSKWSFPATTLDAGDYLVVFASGKDRTDPASELHTNFKLSKSGEYLALVKPDGMPAEFSYSPEYPEQQADVSYGVTVDETQQVYFNTATPGATNSTDVLGFTGTVEFSVPHGYYRDIFSLHLSVDDSTEAIYFTLNGDLPSVESGTLYDGPISIRGTETIRAAAFKTGFETTEFSTQTYIFIEDTIVQDSTSALAKDFPFSFGNDSATEQPSYDMSQSVVGQHGADDYNGVYANTIRDDLVAIPTLSIVTDLEGLFHPIEGIFEVPHNRGVDRPVSVEVIHPDGEDAGYQIDAGMRIQGGISRSLGRKYGLRLLFKEEFGPTKFEYPLFGETRASTFDSLTLRASQGEHLVGMHYIRDRYFRELHQATGHNASAGQFMHVYINGIYWGFYDAVERLDAQHMTNYLGGEKDDWDVYNAGDLGSEGVTPIHGNSNAWRTLLGITNDIASASTEQEKANLFLKMQGLKSDGTNDPNQEAYLDVDNYIDYLIVNVFAGNIDWPHRNYYFSRMRGANSEGFQFFVWDAELSMLDGPGNDFPGLGSEGVAVLHDKLKSSKDYVVRVRDRIQRLSEPGQPLYVDPATTDWDASEPEKNRPAAMYAALVDEAKSPLVAESARWGLQPKDIGFVERRRFLVNEVFLVEAEAYLDDFAKRSRDLSYFASLVGYYRKPPEFSHVDGGIPVNTDVTLTSSDSKIYYTLDGSDPRLPGGAISSSAQLYNGAISIANRTTIRSRSLEGTEWSAESNRFFLVGAELADGDRLRISEVNYHPHDALTQFGDADVGASEFEFVEITNTSTETIDLTGVQLQDDVGRFVMFEFGSQTLAPGARLVIPANVAAFTSRYGSSVPLAVGVGATASDWVLDGHLDNGGELLTLTARDESIIQQFRYDDSSDWPGRADGNASSLEVVDLAGDFSDPNNWRSSSEFGGSPGVAGLGPDNRVVFNEVISNSAGTAVDQVELYNNSSQSLDLNDWYVSDSSKNYFKYQFSASSPIASSGFLVLNQTQLGFGLNSVDGDDLYLIEADANGAPTRFVDRVSFGATEPGQSLGRWSNGEGALFPLTANTLGATNAGPVLGGIQISEFSYKPDPASDGESEFIELTNVTGAAIDLNGYRIRGDVDFDFTTSTIVQPGASVALLGFHPDSLPVPSSDFRTAYSASVASATPLIGSFEGNLGDGGGRISLLRSGTVVDGETPYHLVDEVRYGVGAPWHDPSLVTGTLQRRGSTFHGNFASSWVGEPVGLVCDYVGDGNGCDIADVNALYAGTDGAPTPLTSQIITQWLVDASSADNLAKANSGHVYKYGDANLDGAVNSTDLGLMLNSFGSTAGLGWGAGNFNVDANVDSSDLGLLLNNFGFTSPAQAASDSDSAMQIVFADVSDSGLGDSDEEASGSQSGLSIRDLVFSGFGDDDEES